MCSCGQLTPHAILSRQTSDGETITLYSTGVFSGRWPGLPVRAPTPADLPFRLKAGRMFLGDLCLYSSEEVGAVWKAAVKAARGDGLPGTLRRLYRVANTPRLPLHWQITAADRQGRPTERQARLSALRWPGLAVFDFCGGPGSSRGRYQVFSVQGETAFPTGMCFSRLKDLQAYLEDLPGP